MIDECLVVEFRITGDGCPLADASAASDTPIEAYPPLLRRDGNTLLRFSVPAAAAGLTEALDADDRIRYLHRVADGDRATYRCLSMDPCVLHELADAGLLVESVRYTDGDERLAGSVVGTDVLRGVLAAAGDAVGVTLERMHPLGGEVDAAIGARWDLTPAQEDALRTALEAGYFAVPRDADAAEVAAELGIGKSAFLERLRRGQHRLLEQTLGA